MVQIIWSYTGYVNSSTLKSEEDLKIWIILLTVLQDLHDPRYDPDDFQALQPSYTRIELEISQRQWIQARRA